MCSEWRCTGGCTLMSYRIACRVLDRITSTPPAVLLGSMTIGASGGGDWQRLDRVCACHSGQLWFSLMGLPRCVSLCLRILFAEHDCVIFEQLMLTLFMKIGPRFSFKLISLPPCSCFVLVSPGLRVLLSLGCGFEIVSCFCYLA